MAAFIKKIISWILVLFITGNAVALSVEGMMCQNSNEDNVIAQVINSQSSIFTYLILMAFPIKIMNELMLSHNSIHPVSGCAESGLPSNKSKEKHSSAPVCIVPNTMKVELKKSNIQSSDPLTGFSAVVLSAGAAICFSDSAVSASALRNGLMIYMLALLCAMVLLPRGSIDHIVVLSQKGGTPNQVYA
jgi:hypothetical protein